MSTSNEREPRLPPRAEELLEGWPAPSRGALAWEETASGIMARVRNTAIGSTPDELLAAPLPEEPGEGTRQGGTPAPASNAPAADEPSLAEIARAAVASSEAASREIARDAMIAAEAGRRSPPRDVPPPRAPTAVSAKVAGLQGRVARVSEPGRAAGAAKVAQLAPVPAEPTVAAAHEAAAHSEHPGPPSREARRWNPAVFGSAVLAIAAAAALYVSTSRHAAKDTQLSVSPEASHAGQTRQQAPAPPAEPTALAASAAPEPAQKLALNDLPVVAKSRPASSPAVSAGRENLAFHVKKEKGGEKQLVLEERDEAPAANAVQAAPPAPPAQAAPSLAERPSTGAVQAAFGSVMIGARGCLAGQEEGMRATVTFEGKTGKVKAVALEGAGAGSPAESCVRAALTGARLPPFSEDTFAASVTVRPL